VQLELYSQYLLWFFLISFVFGALANYSSFCTMGAVSDWVNFGDQNRMRSWVTAIVAAGLACGVLEYLGLIDLDLTTSNETSTPPYRNSELVWLRHVVGGFMFGIGMTLASGCGNKTLIRLGEGNLKSIVVLLSIAGSASLMIFTSFDYTLFLQWMIPLSISLEDYGIEAQDVASIGAGLAGIDREPSLGLFVVLAICGLQLVWVFKSSEFRGQTQLIVTGILLGLLVTLGWYLTASAEGIRLIEELNFMDEPPFASGAQSLTFIGPLAHIVQYVYQGFSDAFLSLGVVAIAGVVVGSFIYTLVFKKIRIEWFRDISDFVRHLTGGVLMGIGGVLAMGCTIGQGITGFATMSLGSILAVGSIVIGCMLTMKYQYYRIVYENESRLDALLTSLVEVRLLPSVCRRLDAV
jgi:uncharacterized membrane protein YedE/YeeE